MKKRSPVIVELAVAVGVDVDDGRKPLTRPRAGGGEQEATQLRTVQGFQGDPLHVGKVLFAKGGVGRERELARLGSQPRPHVEIRRGPGILIGVDHLSLGRKSDLVVLTASRGNRLYPSGLRVQDGEVEAALTIERDQDPPTIGGPYRRDGKVGRHRVVWSRVELALVSTIGTHGPRVDIAGTVGKVGQTPSVG